MQNGVTDRQTDTRTQPFIVKDVYWVIQYLSTSAIDHLELLVHENSVTLDTIQCLPDHVLLVEETQVCDEEVEAPALLDHRGEVIVAEEDSQLAVLHHRVKLAYSMVR